MRTMTLPEYQHDYSRFQPDCHHERAQWRTDSTHNPYTQGGFRFVADCPQCKKTICAEGTAWGRITKVLGETK